MLEDLAEAAVDHHFPTIFSRFLLPCRNPRKLQWKWSLQERPWGTSGRSIGIPGGSGACSSAAWELQAALVQWCPLQVHTFFYVFFIDFLILFEVLIYTLFTWFLMDFIKKQCFFWLFFHWFSMHFLCSVFASFFLQSILRASVRYFVHFQWSLSTSPWSWSSFWGAPGVQGAPSMPARVIQCVLACCQRA